jgi:DHA1 family tetracycline resistance protein-like MFS transporter
VAGITSATGAVAGAYIADITDGEDRHFGLMSACFGVGMVAGPGTVGRHLLACTIPCGGGAQRPQPTTGLLLMQESHKESVDRCP